eukprot:10301941-Heterocapsa_arctica.AAC.1
MPIQIELELVSNRADCLAADIGIDAKDWYISDAQVKCDLLQLDNSLENEYTEHLLSGKSLLINCSSWNNTVQQTGGDQNFSVNISRALTRLKSAYVTLYKTPATGSRYREPNYFYHPMITQTEEGSQLGDEHQFWIQIGSHKFPEYPVNSCSEASYQLKRSMW